MTATATAGRGEVSHQSLLCWSQFCDILVCLPTGSLLLKCQDVETVFELRHANMSSLAQCVSLLPSSSGQCYVA